MNELAANASAWFTASLGKRYSVSSEVSHVRSHSRHWLYDGKKL